MTSEMDKDDFEIEALLRDAARDRQCDAPADLMTRVLADAFAAQLSVTAAAPAQRGVSLWGQITSALGGWQGMGGLVAATCVGFWFGVSPPQSLSEHYDLAELFAISATDVQDSESDDFGWGAQEG